jgi:predicted HAD superfamily hydrolase
LLNSSKQLIEKKSILNNINTLKSYINFLSSSIKVISFDVFDTLLHRRLAPPEQVWVPAAKAVIKILKSHDIETTLSSCLKTRHLVTQELSKSTLKSGRDRECHIKDIFSQWLRCYLTEEIAKNEITRIYQIELEAESSVCFPVEGMRQLIRDLKAQGKRIIFISDMYLGVREISGLLSKTGFDTLLDGGYVSSDIGFNKKSGRLYEYVINKENVLPSNLLHVGDNYFSDVLSPRKLGINAIHFRDPDFENWSIRHRKLKKLTSVNSHWVGARWVEMTPPNSPFLQRAKLDTGYAVGYLILGPVLVNFIHQVIQSFNQDKSELVLFPAREGFVLKEIYERLKAKLGYENLPPSKYIFLSRQSTFLASAQEIGDREIVRGLETKPTLRKLLSKLSLEPSRFESLATDCGFGSLDELIKEPLKNAMLTRFLSHPEFKKLHIAIRNLHLDLLYDYLKQFQFWDFARVAFVDVGWTGTIQESMSLAFSARADWPLLNGYYIALLNRSKAPRSDTAKSKFNGVFYNHRYTNNRTGIGRFTELFENATRAPHGTTLGYRRKDNGRVVPILSHSADASYTAEQLDRQLVASLQAGIFDYTDNYTELIQFQNRPPKIHQDFVVSLIDRLVRFPSRKEALALKKLVYINDFGGLLFMPGLDPENPQSDRFRFNNVTPDSRYYVMWPEGYYANKGIPGLTSLFNIYRTIFKQVF